MEKNRLLVISALVLVSAVAFSLGAFKATGLAVVCEPTQTVREYTVQEPYPAFEDKEFPLKYSVLSERAEMKFYDWTYYYVGKIMLKNIDSEAGVFTVRGEFIRDGIKTVKEVAHDLAPQEDKLFYLEYFVGSEEDSVTFSYEIIPGTKVKTETVTKYREEIRYELVEDSKCQ